MSKSETCFAAFDVLL